MFRQTAKMGHRLWVIYNEHLSSLAHNQQPPLLIDNSRVAIFHH